MHFNNSISVFDWQIVNENINFYLIIRYIFFNLCYKFTLQLFRQLIFRINFIKNCYLLLLIYIYIIIILNNSSYSCTNQWEQYNSKNHYCITYIFFSGIGPWNISISNSCYSCDSEVKWNWIKLKISKIIIPIFGNPSNIVLIALIINELFKVRNIASEYPKTPYNMGHH